jgi:hypothetical protein
VLFRSSHDIFKSWPYPKRARIVTTPKELENIGSVQTEVRKWWPTGGYKADKAGKLYYSIFSTTTGWTIDTMTYDQAITEFEGPTIGLFIFNEPPPEAIYDACMARMKFGGKVLMPMTPLANSAWIFDRLVRNDGKNGIRVIYGDTEENCIEHGKNGVLPHAAIKALEDSCDPDDREARLHGKFSHMAGQIFKTFKREAHVIPAIADHDAFLAGKTIYQVVDPAIGKPLASIWAAVGAGGDVTIYQESPEFEFQGAKDSNMGVKEYAELFHALEGHWSPDTRILDRHFGNSRRTVGGLTLKQEFGNAGLDFMDSYTISDAGAEVETGILRVKDYLRYDTSKTLDNLNRPRLQICENCRNSIAAMERWSRDPKNGKPKEEYKDFADVIRYLCMANPELEVQRVWEARPAHYGVNN